MPAKEGLIDVVSPAASGPELSVVGGGAVGLVCALAAADAGWRVRVFDAGADRRAAQVAGGMLGCFGEARPGHDALLAAAVAARDHWPGLLHRLGDPAVTVAQDTLLVAGSAADRADLDETMAWAQAVGAETGAIAQTAAQLRAAEPGLARVPAGGYLLPGEGAVDNRRLLEALRAALRSAGGELVTQTVTDPDQLPGDQILLAAGLDTGALVPGGLPGLRGEKGEVIALRRTDRSVPPPRQVIRGRWHGRNVYLVPRTGGLVLGATQYEAHDGEDRRPQAGGVLDLLTDACEMFPGLRTYEISEVSAGIRPMSPDGLPMVRRLNARTVLAVGHGRNGIALAPGTAARVRDLLAGDTTEDERREGNPR